MYVLPILMIKYEKEKKFEKWNLVCEKVGENAMIIHIWRIIDLTSLGGIDSENSPAPLFEDRDN